MAIDPYVEIAGQFPNDVGVGGALITMVEPNPGFEHDYNRWYEDDHFYAGAMVGPTMFAGRRWVATRDLLSLRFPIDSPVAKPVTAGCYISTYLVVKGHFDDAVRWGLTAMREHLYPHGRGFDQRQHIYTAFSVYEFGVIRDDEAFLQPHHVLDHPFAGMVVEVLEPGETTSRPDLLERLRDDVIPTAMSDSPIAAALAFTPNQLPYARALGEFASGVESPYGASRNLTLLWFVQEDPRACWSRFRQHGTMMSRAGAELVFAAPFIPTVPGTDLYVDELR
jgi:hypothetical protein